MITDWQPKQSLCSNCNKPIEDETRGAAERSCETLSETPTPLIEYTNILHKHGVDSVEARGFKFQFQHDETFQRRAQTLDQLKRELDAKRNEDARRNEDE